MVVLPPTGRVQAALDSNGTGGSNIFSNAGTFTKQGSGLARFGNSGNVTFNNTGTVDVQGGTLSLAGAVAQYSGATHGRHLGSAKRSDPVICRRLQYHGHAANVMLDGATSTFTKINSLVDNQGYFSILSGRNFAAAGSFNNAGTLTIGAGSTFTASSGFVQQATGKLFGSGILVTNVQNAGAIEPGNSPGLLTITGNLTQQSTGGLEMELASANSFDQLKVTGTVARWRARPNVAWRVRPDGRRCIPYSRPSKP